MPKESNPVYEPQVLDFTRAVKDYCMLLEKTDTYELKMWLNKINAVLPDLYLHAVHLPILSPAFEELNQHSITEEDYETVRKKMLAKLGEFDAFEEVFNPDRIEVENAVGESISENLTDIYQDVKDFLLLFEDGSYEVMYEAIWEVQQTFEQYWGQKLVNTLRAVHYLNYSETDIEETDYKPEENINFNDIDTSNWIISRRQEDFRNDE